MIGKLSFTVIVNELLLPKPVIPPINQLFEYTVFVFLSYVKYEPRALALFILTSFAATAQELRADTKAKE